MQTEKLSGGQELLCINTKKVYDWVINDATFDITIDTVDPKEVPCSDIKSLSCEVVPDSEKGIVELGREDREFAIDGEIVTLQLVTLRKNFKVNLFANLTNGSTVVIPDGPFEFSRCEQVVLCAPEGTEIDVNFTDADCFICDFEYYEKEKGEELSDIQITVRLCQSIQSTFEVTLEIVADFCEPREELPVGPCPTPAIPPQCPVIFPGNGDE